MTEIITYKDLNEITPDPSPRHLDKINNIIKIRLQELGIIEKCKEHRPQFKKMATISDKEFELNQYGYKCRDCGARLHPDKFVEYKEEHYEKYK